MRIYLPGNLNTRIPTLIFTLIYDHYVLGSFVRFIILVDYCAKGSLNVLTRSL